MIIYKETEEFKKDFKKLLKKFKTLNEDFDLMKSATIELFHIRKIDNNSIFPCQNQQKKELENKLVICKVKKFACKTLKNFGANTGLRVIYAFNLQNNIVEFLEIYYKSEKKNEDRERIKNYLKNYK